MNEIFYLDCTKNPPTWGQTNNAEFRQIALCMQEALLWRGESPFDIELGIDYTSIFNGESFLTGQLEIILDKYRKFFMDINYTLNQDPNNTEIVEIVINFIYLTGEAESARIRANTKLGRIKNVEIG